MSRPADDPRERFRSLPRQVRREELVETVAVDPPPPVETDAEASARQLWLAAGGTP